MQSSQLKKGENQFTLTPTKLLADLATKINLVEIELLVTYAP